MSSSTLNVPPQNIEAEESVLGAMLVAELALTRVIDDVKLNAGDFYLDRHRLIFETIERLYMASKPVDELTVADALTKRGSVRSHGQKVRAIDAAGGKHYVSELAAKVPAAGNAKHYAEIVKDAACLRAAQTAAQRVIGAVQEGRLNGEVADLSAALGAVPSAPDGEIPQSPIDALGAAAVDLLGVIRDGVPERAFVPGGEPWLIAGKRYLLPAPAGTGKSLLVLVVGVAVVEAGGTVAILDVENGADEYARRLADVLDALGGADGPIAEACAERLRYYEHPFLRVTWGSEEWAAALADVDLAIFDSSRLMLSGAGLAEDSNDDYSTFVNALLVPLARAGVTTLVLDNTGHEERDRARGASAKSDLNEVVYVVKVGEEFDRERTGHLRLVRQRTRFAELPGELHVPVGGGKYGPITAAEPEPDSDGFRPTTLMERISEALELEPGLSKSEVRRAVKGKSSAKDLALRLLVDEGYVSTESDGPAVRHSNRRLYRVAEDDKTVAHAA